MPIRHLTWREKVANKDAAIILFIKPIKPQMHRVNYRRNRLKLASLYKRRATAKRRYQRNKRPPISRLPDEIIIIIFMLHREQSIEWLNLSDEGPTMVDSLDWIKVSHVCRQWRTVSLGFPLLWNVISFVHPKFGLEMMRRSRGSSITVDDTPAYYCSAAALRLREDSIEFKILQDTFRFHLSHVQQLRVRTANILQIRAMLERSRPTSASQLRILSIRNRWDSDASDESLDMLAILETVLQDTRSLKELLIFQTCHWDSRILTNLTHLTIDNSGSKFARPSQLQFLDALRRMPGLQMLCIEGPTLPERTSTTTLSLVNLSCLKSLKLSDTLSTISNFFGSVLLLPDVKIALTMDYKPLTSQSELDSHLNKIYSSTPNLLQALEFWPDKPCYGIEGWNFLKMSNYDGQESSGSI